MSLKKQFISGVIWNSVGRFSSLGVQFIVSIILARMLGPYEFGIIGILSVFIAIAQILLDSGFSQALIQRGRNNPIEYSSVFFVNLFVGLVLYLTLYFFASFLDDFYDINNLHFYARIIFLIIPINALGIIPRTLLTKDLEFNKLSIIELISSVLSGIIGIAAAIYGLGIYALIVQMLSINILRTLLSYIYKRWIVVFRISWESIKDLFSYGINLMFTGLLTVLFNNIHALIIGKYYNANNVGYYNQAKQYEQITSSTITDIVMGVSFPTMVKFKEDINSLKIAYKKIIELIVFIMAPLMIGLMSFSEELFDFILTEKWRPAVPYFNILCIYGATFPLHQINGNVFKVLDKTKTLLYIEIFRRMALVMSIIVTINISISAMLYGQVISMAFVIIIAMYYSGRLINYRVVDQIKDTIGYYIIASISVFLSLCIKQYLCLPNYIVILIMVMLIGSFYLFANYVFKTSALMEIIKLFKINKNI